MTLFDQWDDADPAEPDPFPEPVSPAGQVIIDESKWNWTARTREEVTAEYRRMFHVFLGLEEDIELRKECCQPVIDNRNRQPHPLGEANTRTCYFCARPVAEVSDFFYIVDQDRHVCICLDHKDHVGNHGCLASQYGKWSYSNTDQVMRNLKTSTPKIPRKRMPKPSEEPALIVKKETDEVEVGEVVDEVAEFLKKMGRT